MQLLDTMQATSLNRRMLKDSLREIDISYVIDNLKMDHLWEIRELDSTVLYRSPEINILLVKMEKGTEITSVQQYHSVTFRILKGKLKLHIRNGSLNLNEGESLMLYERTKYRIASMEPTALLLTLAS
jgi:mannose-6-phosphate isomerase-like protein (cupin superfamily)